MRIGDHHQFFTHSRIGLAEDHDLVDILHLVSGLFNFTRIDILAAADHDLFDATGDVDKAILIDHADIAGLQPVAVGKGFLVGFGLFPVARGDANTVKLDFSRHPLGQYIAFGVDAAQLHNG